jgi:hypothetical protein
MEYFEREGEGSVYSEEYLAGGRMIEKWKYKVSVQQPMNMAQIVESLSETVIAYKPQVSAVFRSVSVWSEELIIFGIHEYNRHIHQNPYVFMKFKDCMGMLVVLANHTYERTYLNHVILIFY